MFIKICGLRSAAAVSAAVAAGADALGFVFAESPRRIDPRDAAALCEALPPRVLRVAVMRHPSAEEVQRVLAHFSPDWLQTDASDFATVDLPSPICPLPVYRDDEHVEVAPGSRLLFEGVNSGTGQTADWRAAQAIAGHSRLILAGGLNPDNVGAAIHAVRPWGVDVSSGVERERGIKDPKLIELFIDRVRKLES